MRINKMAYVTIEEAAKLTGKSTQSLYRHVKQGKVSKNHDGVDTIKF
jgi:predicted DNA-binding transcriptional regulator AlpA